MMSFSNLGPFSNQISYQSAIYGDLVRLRDAIQLQLVQQLSINHVLQGQSRALEPPQDRSCPSPVTKLETIVSDEDFEAELDFEDSENKMKPLRQKISHNSSLRNDTKNIPKNYGKAILTFIQKSPKTRKLAAQMGIPYSDFMMHIRRTKKKVNSIEGLRKMWGAENLDHQMKKCIRMLSYDFMRKHCLRYIFHSKVRNYGTHIKYRQKLIEGIANPQAFTHIKDY